MYSSAAYFSYLVFVGGIVLLADFFKVPEPQSSKATKKHKSFAGKVTFGKISTNYAPPNLAVINVNLPTC